MGRSYDFNTEAAKQANGGNYISETGKYIGVFTRAEAVTSEKGTEGTEFCFKDQSGASADFLSLWTHDKDGKELPSFKTFNALLACMRLRGVKSAIGKVEKYNTTTKSRELTDAEIFPDMQNKPIGLLLQKVWRADKPGKYKFEICGVFEASTELTASEILARASAPVRLGQMVANLKDKHEAPRGNTGGMAATSAATAGSSNNFGTDFDDDIPF